MILEGIPLSAFCCFAIITRIASGNVLGIPAMVIERLLGFAGLVAIRNGWKAVVKKNHVSGD